MNERDSHGSPGADPGFFSALVGDGTFPLALTGVALATAGGFALFLCLTGHFLPHDVAHLGMDAKQLARAGNPRLVSFMFHDRAAFGGSLIAIGLLYLWLAWFPLRQGEPWAWWTLAISGAAGFASFLSYLGYGYLDTWHGVATLALLPLYVIGMLRSRAQLRGDRSWRTLVRVRSWSGLAPTTRLGRALLLAYGAGLMVAGATISMVGMTSVFVDTDLHFIGLGRAEICSVSDQLLPVIAHDRAGFGGGLLAIGITISCLVLHAPLSRSFRQAMLASGLAGFTAAIGVHFVVGYVDAWHLAPAFLGVAIFGAGWILAREREARVAPAAFAAATARTQKADA